MDIKFPRHVDPVRSRDRYVARMRNESFVVARAFALLSGRGVALGRFVPVMICLLLVAAAASTAHASDVRVLYTFVQLPQDRLPVDEDDASGGPVGGIAEVRVDPVSGDVLGHRVLHQSSVLRRAEKFDVGAEGRRLIVLSRLEKEPNAIVIRVDEPELGFTELRLPGEPDDLSIFGHHALVGTGDGGLVVIDLLKAEIISTWNVRRGLSPAGHKPEDVEVLPDGRTALVTLQKDNSSGTRHGNRVLVMRVPDLELIADLPLPRDKPELHHPVATNEAGPGPEIIHFFVEEDLLVLSLDLYGAIATTDLSKAIEGELHRYEAHSAAVDGTFGTSFVDRLGVFTRGDDRFILAANAGPDGGAVVLCVRERRIVQRLEVPHGLETLTFLPAQRMVVASAAGKHKERQQPRVIKTRRPRPELWLFPISESESHPLGSQRRAMPLNTFRIVPIAPDANGLLFVTAGTGSVPNEVLIYDVAADQVRSRAAAFGQIRRTGAVRMSDAWERE